MNEEQEKLLDALGDHMKRERLTAKEIAAMLGVSANTMTNWRKGGPMSVSNQRVVSRLVEDHSRLKVDAGAAVPLRPVRASVTPNAFFINAAETFKPVPLLTIAQAKELMPHGLGVANDIPADSLTHFPHANPGDFAVQIAGNSMMPWYPPGTRVLVSREERPQTGNRVIAMLADSAEPIFKIYIDLGGKFALLSINEAEGCAPTELDKMDRGEAWYWVWKIKASFRDEDALDAAMKEFGIRHRWEKWLEERRAEHEPKPEGAGFVCPVAQSVDPNGSVEKVEKRK